jgi:hypothetical protein
MPATGKTVAYKTIVTGSASIGESGRGFVEACFLPMNPKNLHSMAGKEGVG